MGTLVGATLAAALMIAATGCQALAPAAARGGGDVPSAEGPGADARSSGDCVAALRLLAGGALSDWRGLPADCDRAKVELAFGAATSGPGSVAMLGDQLTAYRDYPPGPAAPSGIVVWYEGDEVVAIQINGPALKEPIDQALGPAEATERSLLKAFHSQWIYASRGLTAHVDNITHAAFRLYAYPATTVDTYLRSPLSRVEARRIPLGP